MVIKENDRLKKRFEAKAKPPSNTTAKALLTAMQLKSSNEYSRIASSAAGSNRNIRNPR